MSFPFSTRFSNPPERWSDELVARALRAHRGPARGKLLARFRDLSDFYDRRLAGVSSWAEVPILERQDVASVPARGVLGEIVPSNTSGTSGMRVTVWNDRGDWAFRRALTYRPFSFYPLPQEVRMLSISDYQESRELRGDTEEASGGRVFKRWLIGARASPREQRDAIRRIRPHLLVGLPSALVRLVEETGPGIGGRNLRVVSPAGEFLRVEWRRLLERAFGVPVYDRYGATESGALAWQCPFCGEYHANADETVLEPTPAGLIVTPLFLTAQPLLRYRLSDRIRWRRPRRRTCRIRLPTLEILEARRDDWLYDGDDRKVSPMAFQFDWLRHLAAWRIHQSRSGGITVFLDWKGRSTSRDREIVEADVSEVVRGRPITLVEGVSRCRTAGKFKRVVSEYSPLATGNGTSGH